MDQYQNLDYTHKKTKCSQSQQKQSLEITCDCSMSSCSFSAIPHTLWWTFSNRSPNGCPGNRTIHGITLATFFTYHLWFFIFSKHDFHLMGANKIHTKKETLLHSRRRQVRSWSPSNFWGTFLQLCFYHLSSFTCTHNNALEQLCISLLKDAKQKYICKWIYEGSYIWTAEKDMILWLIVAVTHTT